MCIRDSIYRFLHYLTSQGHDIRLAQYIFIALYLVTLAVVMQCYRQAKAPPYVFPMLILSKRLHSIFLLRLFNDGFAVLFLFVAILCYQRRQWTAGSIAYSFGLGVKMSLLLALPAVGIVLWQGMGRDRALRQAVLMGQLQVGSCYSTSLIWSMYGTDYIHQVLIGFPFLAVHPRSYVSRAFEFSRQFLFKWTVNWRFVGEDIFLSRPFSIALLIAHGAILAGFATTRWLAPSNVTVPQAVQQLLHPPPADAQARTAKRVTPKFIMTAILSAMAIGCLCARSLHYQFYAYIAWSTPFLLWKSGLPPVAVYILWAEQEWAWNVYPSTTFSSLIVVGSLGFTVVGAWLDGRGDVAGEASDAKPRQYVE